MELYLNPRTWYIKLTLRLDPRQIYANNSDTKSGCMYGSLKPLYEIKSASGHRPNMYRCLVCINA
jgi:hypothetical protein